MPATPCLRAHINDFFINIYFPQKGLKLSNLQKKTGSHLQPKNIVLFIKNLHLIITKSPEKLSTD